MNLEISDHKEYIFGSLSDSQNPFSRSIINPSMLFSTGVRVCFYTDSRKVEAKYNLSIKPVVPYIGRSLLNGIVYCVSKMQYSFPLKIESLYTCGDTELIFNQSEKSLNYYELYLPALNQVNSLTIIIEDDAQIYAPCQNDSTTSTLIFLGGNLTIGHGCTFATAMYTQIIAHKLHCNFYNFALPTNNYLDASIAEKSAKLGGNVIVTEIESMGMSYDYLKNNLHPYLETLIKNCTSPIVAFTQPFWGDRSNDYDAKMNHLKQTIKELRETYPNRLLLVNGEHVFKGIDYDEFSFSANFINDNANYILANYLTPIIDTIII